MFFKKIWLFSLAFISILASFGCSEFLKGKKVEPEVIEFSDKRFACLQSLPGQLGKFSVGEASEREIRQGFDCMAEALTYFNRKTFGSMPDAYSVEEIRHFFGKYFLKENNVTPEFAIELMKLKKTLLGGSVEVLTKEELVNLIELLKVVREEAVVLSPHMSVLLKHSVKIGVEWQQISSAVAQLRLSLRVLLVKSRVVDADYSIEDAKKAFAGFADFVRGQNSFGPYENLKSWVPIVESVKAILMGKQAHFNGTSQWEQSLDNVLELYEMVLKYIYVFNDFQFNEPAKLKQLAQLLNQGLDLLLDSHQLKATGVIPLADIDQLIDTVLPKVKTGLSAQAIKKTYRIVLMKFFDPERVQDSRSLLGVERKHLLTMKTELNVWRLKQGFIDNLSYSKEKGDLSYSSLLAAYSAFDYKSVIVKHSEDLFERQALLDSWEDFGALVKDSKTVLFNKEGRLLISRWARQNSQSWKNLTRFNLMQTLSRLLMLAYGENVHGPMSQAHLLEKGLVSWYRDFSEIGQEFKAFDPRAGNSGQRSFLEANFFTFNGNGDDVLDQKEIFEFVNMLFSAGLGTSNDIVKHMNFAGCAVQEKDIFGFAYIKEACFKKQIKDHMQIYFANLPGLVLYTKGLNAAQWEQFFNYLVTASAVKDQRKGYLETANIRTIVTILYYIETIFVEYDRDHNQGLSLAEVYLAAPRFMSFFKKVSPTSFEFLLKEGFAHLVFYGEIPGATGVAALQWRKLFGIQDAQRMEIARLFGTIKEQLNKFKN